MVEEDKSPGTTVEYNTTVDDKYKVYASVAFAVLLLGVGVPLWWHTTAVPRVSLPYAGIERLSELKISIGTKIILAALSSKRADDLANEIMQAFEFADICEVEVEKQVIVNMAVDVPDFDIKAGQLFLIEAKMPNDAVLVGAHRILYFSTKTKGSTLVKVLSEWMLREKSLKLTKNALTKPTLFSLDEENKRRFPPSPAYDILITVVNPDPDKLKVDWDLRQISQQYVEPFVEGIPTSNFSVKSQWLYFLPLEVSPKRVPDSSPWGRHFALSEDVLPQLITPLEKKLASQVSLHPTINFVVYFVPADSAPLHIYTRSGVRSKDNTNVEAFLSPRWGGVVLINPSFESISENTTGNRVTVAPSEDSVVGTILAQLKLLLGVPEPTPIPSVVVASSLGLKLHGWEMDALMRVRTIEQLTSAKLTLQSLAKLLKEIGNIVITDVVGDRIKTALHLVEYSAERLADGDLEQGFVASKKAFVAAEAAFSDPTLLSLLYFPDDQKYAVYIPLFLPAMIPVLLSLRNIYRYYVTGTRRA